MLTPEQLAYCADDMIKLYAQLEEQIIRDVARRISKTGIVTESGAWQVNALQEIGMLHSDILSSIAKYTDKSEATLKKLFEDAAVTATEYDNEIYRSAGLTPKSIKVSASQMQILEAGYKKTNGNINNLTKTTAVATQTSFINACSLAELKTTSGAFSYEQAIIDAIKQIASDGAFVLYPSGHRDRIDVAVRRNVMTGLGQTTGEICLANAREIGWDLMEITAHAGARPSHASWQGQIVSLSGRSGYLTLSDIGYGSGDGFKGYNCRHDWYPYYESSRRMYSEKDLEELDSKNIEFPDGSKHTLYEAEQKQKSYERKIRELKRILAAQDEFIKNTSSKTLKEALKRNFDDYAIKLKRKETEMKAFCKKTGLLTDTVRTRKYGFGKSTAQKTIWVNKHSLKIATENFQFMQYLSDIKKHKIALKEHQMSLLNDVPNRNDIAIIKKKDIKISDLAALTAHTGDEFAYFTKGKKAILVHGNPSKWSITGEYYEKIMKERWEWTAHSHPTTDKRTLPSKEDKDTLKLFTWQKESSIINLEGRITVFTCDEQNWFNMILGVN